MRHHDHITSALQSILLNYAKGYTRWVSFAIDVKKVEGIGEKWAETLGTRLPAWKRQDRKQKQLANAVALSAPILSTPNKRQIILMATEHVIGMPENTPWRRERWLTRLPEFSDFVMVREARERGDLVWTWRLQDRILGGLESHLTSLVKAGDASAVRQESGHWTRIYPMFGGVRRQLRRTLNSARKLWTATVRSPWPGAVPEALPMMIGFRSLDTTQADPVRQWRGDSSGVDACAGAR